MRNYEELVKALRDEDNCNVLDYIDEAADAIEDLIAALTASNEVIAKSRDKWISVEERLPIRGDRVLVTSGGFVCEAYLSTADNWIRGGTPLFYMTPTHWMPLPEPPKEDDNG